MNSDQQSGVKPKLFIGLHLTPDLHAPLEQSTAWKQSRVAPAQDDLCEIHHQKKHYIGYYFEGEKASLKELQIMEAKIRKTLIQYSSKFTSLDVKVLIFPQIFIS